LFCFSFLEFVFCFNQVANASQYYLGYYHLPYMSIIYHVNKIMRGVCMLCVLNVAPGKFLLSRAIKNESEFEPESYLPFPYLNITGRCWAPLLW